MGSKLKESWHEIHINWGLLLNKSQMHCRRTLVDNCEHAKHQLGWAGIQRKWPPGLADILTFFRNSSNLHKIDWWFGKDSQAGPIISSLLAFIKEETLTHGNLEVSWKIDTSSSSTLKCGKHEIRLYDSNPETNHSGSMFNMYRFPNLKNRLVRGRGYLDFRGKRVAVATEEVKRRQHCRWRVASVLLLLLLVLRNKGSQSVSAHLPQHE